MYFMKRLLLIFSLPSHSVVYADLCLNRGIFIKESNIYLYSEIRKLISEFALPFTCDEDSVAKHVLSFNSVLWGARAHDLACKQTSQVMKTFVMNRTKPQSIAEIVHVAFQILPPKSKSRCSTAMLSRKTTCSIASTQKTGNKMEGAQ